MLEAARAIADVVRETRGKDPKGLSAGLAPCWTTAAHIILRETQRMQSKLGISTPSPTRPLLHSKQPSIPSFTPPMMQLNSPLDVNIAKRNMDVEMESAVRREPTAMDRELRRAWDDIDMLATGLGQLRALYPIASSYIDQLNAAISLAKP